MDYARHQESSAVIPAPTENVLAHVDEHMTLSFHMTQPSWRMSGGKMEVTLDGGVGKKAGSKIGLSGRALGIPIRLEEIGTERTPPFRKTWEIVCEPKLRVIGHYRMGVEITPQQTDSLLRVFLDYDLPGGTPLEQWAGYLFGGYHAKRCTQQMVDDTKKHFSASAKSH